MQYPNQSDTKSGSGEIVKSFQIDDLSIKSKSDERYGKSLAKFINSTYSGNASSNYYYARNTRILKNEAAAAGKINMQKFIDLLEFNGKTNYANLNWQSIKIVQRIVSGLVGRWMQRNERISARAIDSLSVKQKLDQYEHLEFVIDNREKLQQLQDASGVQMIPQGPIPADQEELNLWQPSKLRIPEEILYEQGCNETFQANGLFDVMKRKLLHDSCVSGFVGTYTWMDDQGVVITEWVKPLDAIYSYSEYPDFRDTTWRGRIKHYKISEIRRKYGQQFGGKLTEENLWKIANTAKEYRPIDSMRWNNIWTDSFFRPYDEWNVECIEFEFKSVDAEGYTFTETKQNKSTIFRKGAPKKIEDNQEYVKDDTINIYRGVYVKQTEMMLEWGIKKNMIRPQDPKETGNAEFSYSFYMYQNFNGRNIAVPEKVEVPVDMMIITLLKIQQVISKMRPPGAVIREDVMQDIDWGLGDANKTIDHKKYYDQTGDIYYRGIDGEGKPVPVPIQELANSGFLPAMQGLIAQYQFQYQALKDELGEDPNLISQALQPRVTSGNVDTAQQTAENATDYMYYAYVYVMQDTARKVGCLIKDSVEYGSTAYRHLMQKEDVYEKIFNIDFMMMPTEGDLQKFDIMLNNAITSNPELNMYLNSFQVLRIAKEDIKLAEEYFRNAQKKMFVGQQQQAQANSQQQANVQMQSAQAAEQGKQQTEQLKNNGEIVKAQTMADGQTKVAAVTAAFGMLLEKQKSGTEIPAEVKPLINAILQNVALPMMIENDEIRQQIAQQMQQAQQPQQQEPEPQQQPQEQGQQQMQPAEAMQ